MSVTPPFRLAIATSTVIPTIHPDDASLALALARRGVEPMACVWNDGSIDWSAFDAVLLRTTWDYFKHHAAFLAWLDLLDRLDVPVINDSATARWNSDKRYLDQLAARGVGIIPGRSTSFSDLADTLRTFAGQNVVVKPTVSGGAWHTVRGMVGDHAFGASVAALPSSLDYMVQPFVQQIVDDGEWSLMFFDGRFSHAVIKRPATGDYRIQTEFGGTAELADPTPSTLAAAERVLAATAELGYPDQSYARIDGVVVDDRFLLMELELIEPLMHLAIRPDAAEAYARAVVARMARTMGQAS
jgi:glutathione synthase/RimK-type ligase-like ATP-grasp enzyme